MQREDDLPRRVTITLGSHDEWDEVVPYTTEGILNGEEVVETYDVIHWNHDAHVDDYRIHLAVRRRLEYELEPYAGLDELSEVIMLDLGCIGGRVIAMAEKVWRGTDVPSRVWDFRLPDPDAPPWDFSY